MATIWTGRVLSILCALFLLFDAIGHILKPAPVVDAFARLGMPLNFSVGLGILELVLIALYLVPQTGILGAVLLTGYLGGATAVNLRAGSPPFEVLFPVLFGVVVWIGIALRAARARGLFFPTSSR